MTRIVPLLQGHIRFDPRLFPAARDRPVDAARLLGLAELPDRIDVPIWCYLVLDGAFAGLVDTGAGGLFGDRQDRLAEALADHGVTPGDIARVWLTHLHGDHCGGLIGDAGTAVFPMARIAVPKAEAEYWLEGRHAGGAAEIARDAAAALAPYGERIDLVAPGVFVDGALARPAPGHTPGHTAWLFERQAALAAGDIVHVPAFQIASPHWSSDWDMNPLTAADSRRDILALARERRLTLLTGHAGMLEPDHLAPRKESP